MIYLKVESFSLGFLRVDIILRETFKDRTIQFTMENDKYIQISQIISSKEERTSNESGIRKGMRPSRL